MDVDMSGTPPSDPAKEAGALRSLLGGTSRDERFDFSDPRCHAPEGTA